MLFLRKNNKDELQNDGLLGIVGFLCNIKKKFNSHDTDFQGEKKIISQIANYFPSQKNKKFFMKKYKTKY